jgi:hypothetical protein
MYAIPTGTGSNRVTDCFLPYARHLAAELGADHEACAGVRSCRHVQTFAKYTHIEVV